MILLLVPMLRPHSASYIGEDSYFNIRMAESMSPYDSLSYGGRVSAYNLGLPMMLSLSPLLLARFLPFMLGLLSFILFGLLLDYFEVKERNLGLLLLAVSPPFIYMFSTLNSYFVAVFLALLGFFLFSRKSRIFVALAMLVFSIMPFFNLMMALICSVLVIFFGLFKLKMKKRYAFTIFILIIIVSFAYYGYMAYAAGEPINLFFKTGAQGFNATLMSMFSELGGKFGLAIFGVILFVFGLVYSWDRKYKELSVFFSIMFLIILAFFRIEPIILLNFMVCLFAAKGFAYLCNKEWGSSGLKQFTILVLVCGLIFSSLSFVKEAVREEPSDGIIQGLDFLSRLNPGTVFSVPERGKWINYAGMPNVMDTNYIFAPQLKKRWADTQLLLNTRDLKVASEIFERYGIRYIWIDSGFKGKIWSYDEDGLLFIMKYNPDIERIYNQGGVEIWEVYPTVKLKNLS
ncbi:MAG: hypothetical protein V1906_02340 [Candidatus Woesearchaeota archaeon]